MAGTNKSAQQAAPPGPTVILVQPQLGENIGMAARAMLNFGLQNMRLVAPRRQWLSDKTRKASAGADVVLDAAQIFHTPADAVADLTFVLATSARARDMVKPVMSPDAAVARLMTEVNGGGQTGILFGPERSGLDNDSVVLADALVRVPVNPGFGSLNLAQGVLLMGYVWFQAKQGNTPGETLPMPATRPAEREELMGFYGQLEAALDEAGFLHPPEKRPAMVRNIRNFFLRARPTEQDVRTLRGVVSALQYPRHRTPK